MLPTNCQELLQRYQVDELPTFYHLYSLFIVIVIIYKLQPFCFIFDLDYMWAVVLANNERSNKYIHLHNVEQMLLQPLRIKALAVL